MKQWRRCTEPKCGNTLPPNDRHKRCSTCRNSSSKCSCGQRKRNEAKKCTNCVSRKRENNPNWRGGKTYHKKGYVMVLAPDHPRAKSGKYVFEHILVMEEHLGRYLDEEETVHHKNTVKDDNRLKNLELWRGAQPTGARVSDLVDWAKEILAKYDPDLLR